MPKTQLIADDKFIAEDYHVTNLLDTSALIQGIDADLGNARNASITALLGGYGTGKSTALYHLSEQNKDKETWIWFDAWKYPERQNLWEGFVLDFAKQVTPGDFDKVLRLLDGTSKDAAKTLIKAVGVAANIAIPGSGAAIDKLTYFATTSPARRVFQIQDILVNLINNHAKLPIRIVVEDIDRSQDKGVFFLETLNNFLATNSFSQEIKIIVPMSRDRYEDEEESFSKCIHYTKNFNPKLDLKNYAAQLLTKEACEMLINAEVTKLDENQLAAQLATFLNHYARTADMNFRKIKKLIRQWAKSFAVMNESYDFIDWRVLLCATAMRTAEKPGLVIMDSPRLHNGEIHMGSHWSDYLAAIVADRAEYQDTEGKLEFSLNGLMMIHPRGHEGLLPTYKRLNRIDKGTVFDFPEEYFRF